MANMGSMMTQEDLKGLKNLIDSEVYAGFMRQGDKRGPGDVDAFKIAKDFLVDIVEIMTDINEEFTLQVTDEYLKLALQSTIDTKKKNDLAQTFFQ